VGIFSCFTNISVQEDKRTYFPKSDNYKVEMFISEIYEKYQRQRDVDSDMQFDIIDFTMRWCECTNDVDCKLLLQEISAEKDIFLGEFIKAIFKINNMVNEMKHVAELTGDIMFLSTLTQIPVLTLKYVATNQSLYI
jgi:hypothetical protein